MGEEDTATMLQTLMADCERANGRMNDIIRGARDALDEIGAPTRDEAGDPLSLADRIEWLAARVEAEEDGAKTERHDLMLARVRVAALERELRDLGERLGAAERARAEAEREAADLRALVDAEEDEARDTTRRLAVARAQAQALVLALGGGASTDIYSADHMSR